MPLCSPDKWACLLHPNCLLAQLTLWGSSDVGISTEVSMPSSSLRKTYAVISAASCLISSVNMRRHISYTRAQGGVSVIPKALIVFHLCQGGVCQSSCKILLWMDFNYVFGKCRQSTKELLISFWWCSWFWRDFDLWYSKDQSLSCNLIALLPIYRHWSSAHQKLQPDNQCWVILLCDFICEVTVYLPTLVRIFTRGGFLFLRSHVSLLRRCCQLVVSLSNQCSNTSPEPSLEIM